MSAWRAPRTGRASSPRGTRPSSVRAAPSASSRRRPAARCATARSEGVGGRVVGLAGVRPSRKNPALCSRCCDRLPPGGADVAVLFADVRGSTVLGRERSAAAFAEVLDRFYKVATETLVRHDAVVARPPPRRRLRHPGRPVAGARRRRQRRPRVGRQRRRRRRRLHGAGRLRQRGHAHGGACGGGRGAGRRRGRVRGPDAVAAPARRRRAGQIPSSSWRGEGSSASSLRPGRPRLLQCSRTSRARHWR